MVKGKKKFPIFVITLVIGLGIIGFAFYEADFSFGTVTDFGSVTSFSIIDVPIDPTTGGILGTIVIGAPDVKPFEQAGTIFGIPEVRRSLSPRTPCTDNFLSADGVSIVKVTEEPLMRDVNGRTFLMPPEFERRLSGERNQIDPIWWGSLRDVGAGSNQCAFAYAQFDIVDIPNDFVATSGVLKLEVIQGRTAVNPTFQVAPQQCDITIQDFDLDTISDEGIMNQIYHTGNRFPSALRDDAVIPPSDAVLLARGSWCNSVGVKTIPLPQGVINLINDAISGGAFDQGVRSDKLLLGFTPTHLNNEGNGKNQISTDYWKREGSIHLVGSSPPIRCSVGFNQVDFRCVPIVCDLGESLNQSTNECEPIVCEAGETLEFTEATVCPDVIGIDCTPLDATAICTPIQCNIGEELVGSTCQTIQCPSDEHLVGAGCEPLFCDEGFEAVNNQCTVITCDTGMELVGGSCQAIACPVNTVLQGSDCVELQCSSSETIYNNECRNTQELCQEGILTCDPIIPPIVECPTGFNQVGANCVIAPESCPAGTEPHENVCVQVVPSLLQLGGVEPSLLLLTGVIITGASGIGIAVRRRG